MNPDNERLQIEWRQAATYDESFSDGEIWVANVQGWTFSAQITRLEKSDRIYIIDYDEELPIIVKQRSDEGGATQNWENPYPALSSLQRAARIMLVEYANEISGETFV